MDRNRLQWILIAVLRDTLATLLVSLCLMKNKVTKFHYCRFDRVLRLSPLRIRRRHLQAETTSWTFFFFFFFLRNVLFAKQVTTYITYNTALTPLPVQRLYSQSSTYITYITLLTLQYLHRILYNT